MTKKKTRPVVLGWREWLEIALEEYRGQLADKEANMNELADLIANLDEAICDLEAAMQDLKEYEK